MSDIATVICILSALVCIGSASLIYYLMLKHTDAMEKHREFIIGERE